MHTCAHIHEHLYVYIHKHLCVCVCARSFEKCKKNIFDLIYGNKKIVNRF